MRSISEVPLSVRNAVHITSMAAAMKGVSTNTLFVYLLRDAAKRSLCPSDDAKNMQSIRTTAYERMKNHDCESANPPVPSIEPMYLRDAEMLCPDITAANTAENAKV